MASATCCPTKRHEARGMCKHHYERWLYHNRTGRETKRQYDLKKRYNLTPEQRAAMPNQCQVCGNKNALHVDHNHVTGQVRGILCTYCNTALGILESPLYPKLKDYLHGLGTT